MLNINYHAIYYVSMNTTNATNPPISQVTLPPQLLFLPYSNSLEFPLLYNLFLYFTPPIESVYIYIYKYNNININIYYYCCLQILYPISCFCLWICTLYIYTHIYIYKYECVYIIINCLLLNNKINHPFINSLK